MLNPTNDTPELAEQRRQQSEIERQRRPIIIKNSNADRIENRLGDGQQGAKVRLLDYGDLNTLAEDAEKTLAELTKEQRVGAYGTLSLVHNVANAYRGIAEHTVAHVVRRPGGWALTHAERKPIWVDAGVRVTISAEQWDTLTSRLRTVRKLTVSDGAGGSQ